MSSRESVEAAVASVEAAAEPTQVLPEQVVPVPAEQAVEQASPGETAEQKDGRTAGRPRDEHGRLLPGKPVKNAAPEPQKPTVPTPPAAAAPVAAPQPPAIPRPASWKKDHWPAWDKLAVENPQLAQYLNQREREFTTGVTTYKQEFERVQPLAQAIQPFEQMLQHEGIPPAQWIGAVANAHRILRYGNDQERLQAGLKLIQDYRIPVLEYLQQGGQLQPAQLGQQQTPQVAQPQQDPRALVREEIMAMQSATELEQFRSAADADGNPLYPHYEEVKLDMAQLLEAGRAQDLKSAYTKAIRMNDELWQQEQERAQQANEAARQQQQAKVVAKAKANTVSVKSATPTGAIPSEKPKGTRSSVEAAYEAAMGHGGRV